ncbi:HU family DNA-binding protein [Parabacteroides sp.]
MAMNYKLVQKAMPGKPDAPKKWYAVPNSSTPMTGKAMTRAATANTTTAPIEMEASLELLAAFVPQQLKQGHTVKIPGLGTFRLTFKSDGVEDINDFKASSMIKDARIAFTPDKELRNSVLAGLTFEDGGVLEGDISYASLADYRLAKGIGTGGSTSGGSSDSDSPSEI